MQQCDASGSSPCGQGLDMSDCAELSMPVEEHPVMGP